MAFVGDAADGMRQAAQSRLRYRQIAGLLKGLDLGTKVTTRGFGNRAQIDEISTLEPVERHHDLQSELVVEQGIDNRKLKGHDV